MAQLRYNDDFNAYALNQAPPSPWVAQPGAGGAVEVVGDPAAGAPQGRVVRIFDNDTGSRSVLRLDYVAAGLGDFQSNPLRNDVTLEFYVRAAQTNRQLLIGFRENISGTPGGDRRVLSLKSNGQFGYHTDLGQDSATDFSPSVSYVADTWYKVLFVYDRFDRTKWSNNNLVAFWLDGVKKGTTHNAGLNNNFFDQLVFWTNPNEGAATFFVDDVRIGSAYSAAAGLVRKLDGDPAAGARSFLVRRSDGALLITGVSNISGQALFAGDVLATENLDSTPCTILVFGPAPGEGASVRPDISVI